MFVLRQMVEKRLELQGSLALGFVPWKELMTRYQLREMVMATLQWMGVSEAEVRMVERTYEMTTAKRGGGRGRIR